VGSRSLEPGVAPPGRDRFALTAFRLRSAADFPKNVRKAIEKGLPWDAALEAVTVAAARLLGVDSILGTVEAGKIANLIMTDGDLFAEKTKIKKVFVDGEPYEVGRSPRTSTRTRRSTPVARGS